MRGKENQDRSKRRRLALRNGIAASFSGGKERGNSLSWESPPPTHAYTRARTQADTRATAIQEQTPGTAHLTGVSVQTTDHPQTTFPIPTPPTHRSTCLDIPSPHISPFEHNRRAQMPRLVQTVASLLAQVQPCRGQVYTSMRAHVWPHGRIRAAEPQLYLCTGSPLSPEIPAGTRRGDQLLRA